jgi:capsular polysaccharide biosynthesis protein
MKFTEFLKNCKKRRKNIIIITFVIFIVFLFSVIIQPFDYKATSKLLVIQKDDKSDAYNISRSNQFISGLLAEIVYSDSFFDEVMAKNANIQPGVFSAKLNERRLEWKDAVDTKAIGDTGIIEINTYQRDKKIAEQISMGIAEVLRTNHAAYHGLGDKIEVKIIDRTTVSDWPMRPNIILDLLAGIICGILLGGAFVYFFPDKELRIVRQKNNPAQEYVFSDIADSDDGFEQEDNSPVANNNFAYNFNASEENIIDNSESLAPVASDEAEQEETVLYSEKNNEDAVAFNGNIKNIF